MEYSTVAVNKCGSYDVKELTDIIRRQFSAIGICRGTFSEKKIVIKPNLVMNKEPDFAATTNPAVIAATARVLRELGADSLFMAESSGGPYSTSTIKAHYNGCGMTEMAQAESITLHSDTSSEFMPFPDGQVCRGFNVISPIADADVIINVCKLKTHALTKMSCGIKNFYGVIPGTEKVEMHARFPHAPEFQEMLIDLCEMLCRNKTVITVCDGIVGMEGNGPTGGTPRKFGAVLSSLSPFCLDLAAEAILGFSGTVGYIKKAADRSLCPACIDMLDISGDKINDIALYDVIQPDTSGRNILRDFPDLFGGRLVRFLEPHPVINTKTCIGCGKCADSCPAKTISIVSKGSKKQAHINKANCIRCYCCQELCPINSVKIKKNILLKIVH